MIASSHDFDSWILHVDTMLMEYANLLKIIYTFSGF